MKTEYRIVKNLTHNIQKLIFTANLSSQTTTLNSSSTNLSLNSQEL